MTIAEIEKPNERGLQQVAANERLTFFGLTLPYLLMVTALIVIPVGWLFYLSFIGRDGSLSFENYERMMKSKAYIRIFLTTFKISILTTIICAAIGYPLAYLIAKTDNVARNTFVMILVLCAMQLDMVIRLFGLMVLMGDNGLINGALMYFNIIEKPIGLMYNKLGVLVGLVQFSLPFMVLSLIGIIRGISPAVVEASRSLGASPNQAFWKIIIPLSMPGILAGTLLVFAISISSYIVPALMGGWKVMVMPLHVYQQIAEMGKWQFGSAIAVVLFCTSLLSVIVYQRVAIRIGGGRA